jgi:PEP-CTERM motif
MTKVLAFLLAASCASVAAQAQVLTFEGIASGANFAPVGNFYNGGAGPNFGVQFFGTPLALNNQAPGCGGSSGISGNQDCSVVLWGGGTAGLNVSAGFATAFSLLYSAPAFNGSVSIYDALNGSGTLLASFDLPVNVTGFPLTYRAWSAAGVSFAGVARSVVFTGVQDAIGFDNVTFGSVIPGVSPPAVPEPSTALLTAAGLVGLAVAARRRRFLGSQASGVLAAPTPG